jgi:hypothetical protein
MLACLRVNRVPGNAMLVFMWHLWCVAFQ